MIYYFLIFFKFITFGHFQNNFKNLGFSFFILSFLILIFFVGFRHNVGGDFMIYKEYYYSNYDAERNFFLYDILLSLFRANKIPFNIFLFSIGVLCLYSIYSYSLNYKNFPLILMASLPFIITILFMGYIRQGIAFSFLLLSIQSIFKDSRNGLFYLYIIIGSLFHLSLIIFLPLRVIINLNFNYQLVWKIFLIILLSILIYYIFYNDFKNFIYGYLIDKSLSSDGSLYRISINLIFGFAYILFLGKINDQQKIKKLFILFFVSSLTLFFLSFYFPVFADRMNYYLIPLQLHIIGNLHKIFKNNLFLVLVQSLVVFAYFSIYLTWFNFGNFSHVWKNYDICILNCTNLRLMENFN